MNSLADRRDTRRVVVGPEYIISFNVKGHAFREVRITNLSVGGCFAMVGVREARLLMRGAALEDLILAHPELPKDPIIATVSYVLGGRPGQDPQDLAGVGIQFLCMEAMARESLEVWVGATMAAQQAEANL